jgi:hypothetical protein
MKKQNLSRSPLTAPEWWGLNRGIHCCADVGDRTCEPQTQHLLCAEDRAGPSILLRQITPESTTSASIHIDPLSGSAIINWNALMQRSCTIS